MVEPLEAADAGMGTESYTCGTSEIVDLGALTPFRGTELDWRQPIEALWTGERFLVGYYGGELGTTYQIRAIEGDEVVAEGSVLMDDQGARSLTAQLLMTAEGPSVFRSDGERVYRTILDESLAAVREEVVFDLLSDAPAGPYQFTWRAIPTGEGAFEVVNGGYEVGFDSREYVYATPLGHGSWQLLDADRRPTHFYEDEEAWGMTWLPIGSGYVGAGTVLVSAPGSERHAGAFVDSADLLFAVTGQEPVRVAGEPDSANMGPHIDVAWDGEGYAWVYSRSIGAERRLFLRRLYAELPLEAQMEMVPEEDTRLLGPAEAGQNSPAVAAAGPGDFGVAFVEGSAVRFVRRGYDCPDTHGDF